MGEDTIADILFLDHRTYYQGDRLHGEARNNACFNAKLIRHPAEIVCRACAFLSFWAGLHKDTMQAQIKEGVGLLLSMACQMLANQSSTTTRMLLPPPPNDQDTDEAAKEDDEE
ncbi:hypothetical protein PVAP13_9NG639501 [Panicum virgatum]|uniref:Uncharacterized protein n=1 Tax=Panicum virgatum TaxID=38727 RepID=A0A8T0N0T9_PANVG|nr:hypothetical protein PVAP13_9NG639501 [Panicum virgatum]